MIGLGFLARVFQFLIAVAILGAIFVAVYYCLTWVFRLVVEAFGWNNKAMVVWLRSKVGKKSK